MNKPACLSIVFLYLILALSTGCIVNKAIPASAIADNLAVEKSQNEMLLLNVLRGKDHYPMVVTGISKITGSIKAEASLNGTIPLGSFRGDGSKSASNYVASPTATYNWNPSFDVNVFDNNEFMRGFLTPVSSDIFAYYWNLGFYPQVLLNLMVMKIDVRKVSGCGDVGKGAAGNETKVKEFILINNHEWGDVPPKELEKFGEWVDQFLDKAEPYFEEGRAERLGPIFGEETAEKALVQGLKEGFTLAEVTKAKEGPAGKESKFQFERTALPKQILTLKGGDKTLESLYNWTAGNFAEAFHEREGAAGDCASEDTTTQSTSDLMKGKKYTITLFLRSPEAILYYLGELARIEEGRGETAYYCLGGKSQPLFVVRHSGECGNKSAQVTNANGVSYAIPTPVYPPPQCDSKKTKWRNVTCDGGRSMEALTMVSQLIALQKSAKDMPTTSVVRVVGQ